MLKRKLRKRKNRNNAKQRNREYVLSYLKKQYCIDCGENDPVVLQFDHVRGKKKHDISHLIRGQYSIKSIIEEIKKCEVRCGNCHLKRTSQDQKWYKNQK